MRLHARGSQRAAIGLDDGLEHVLKACARQCRACSGEKAAAAARIPADLFGPCLQRRSAREDLPVCGDLAAGVYQLRLAGRIPVTQRQNDEIEQDEDCNNEQAHGDEFAGKGREMFHHGPPPFCAVLSVAATAHSNSMLNRSAPVRGSRTTGEPKRALAKTGERSISPIRDDAERD